MRPICKLFTIILAYKLTLPFRYYGAQCFLHPTHHPLTLKTADTILIIVYIISRVQLFSSKQSLR